MFSGWANLPGQYCSSIMGFHDAEKHLPRIPISPQSRLLKNSLGQASCRSNRSRWDAGGRHALYPALSILSSTEEGPLSTSQAASLWCPSA